MILEAFTLNIKPGMGAEFEQAMRNAAPLIAAAPGYLSHELHRCVEVVDRYLFMVHWNTLDDHVVGFRGSPAYQEWRALTHHFYAPMPTVEHFEQVDLKS